MAVKASDLLHMLQEDIEKFGDGNMMIYDEYIAIYKTFSRNNILSI